LNHFDKNLKKASINLFGHVIRRAGFQNTVTGKIEGNRGRGKPKENILNDKARWLGRKPNELISDTKR
jgi:hypothetical protein